jgi:hypothetical protein
MVVRGPLRSYHVSWVHRPSLVLLLYVEPRAPKLADITVHSGLP